MFYQGKGKHGDYAWMLQQPKYDSVLHIYNENLEQYRRKYSDREGLEAVISKTDLGGEGPLDEAVRQLDEAFFFQVGDYVFHERGWGIGRVVEAHPETGELVTHYAPDAPSYLYAPGGGATATARGGGQEDHGAWRHDGWGTCAV